MAKNITKYCLRLLLGILVCVLIGALLLTAVYCVPGRFLAGHMEESAWTLIGEGLYPWLYPWCTRMVDNYTDAYMLQHASYRNEQSPLMQAMQVYRPTFQGRDYPHQDIVDHYQDGKAYDAEGTYSRYWHGYLVYLTPLMLVFSYSQIRLINGVFQTALALLLCWLLYKRGKKQYILPLLLVLCFWMPVVQAKCLQYSACHYLMLFGCIALVWNQDRLSRVEAVVFFLLGVGTAYIDYLTYPVVVLGIPLALYYVLRLYGGFWEDVGKGVKLSLTWAVGYVGMWAGKWILATLITGENVILDATGKLLERTEDNHVFLFGKEEVVLNPASRAIEENGKFFWDTPATYLLILVVAVLVVLLAVRLVRRKASVRNLAKAAPFLVIAAMPYAWYALVANHSLVHCWFTCKALAVLVFALVCMLLKVQET